MKFTAAIAADIVALVRKGRMRKVAAAAVRVSERTVKGWSARGRQNVDDYEAGRVADLDDYGLFLMELENAEALVRGEAEEGIHAAGAKDWRAWAWLLKHRYPAEYSARVEVTGKDGESLFEGAREKLAEQLRERRNLKVVGGGSET